MDVGQRVVVSIPSTKAEVEATNSRITVVHQYNFLVMGPELDAIFSDRLLRANGARI